MTGHEYEKARAAIDIADSMFGDLPDGAYWAACEEVGAGMDLQIEVQQYEDCHPEVLHEN
jgi:hypothetical protein